MFQSFRGFSPWLLVPWSVATARQSILVGGWQKKAGFLMVARKQRDSAKKGLGTRYISPGHTPVTHFQIGKTSESFHHHPKMPSNHKSIKGSIPWGSRALMSQWLYKNPVLNTAHPGDKTFDTEPCGMENLILKWQCYSFVLLASLSLISKANHTVERKTIGHVIH
jgi:hypothetical protein